MSDVHSTEALLNQHIIAVIQEFVFQFIFISSNGGLVCDPFLIIAWFVTGVKFGAAPLVTSRRYKLEPMSDCAGMLRSC